MSLDISLTIDVDTGGLKPFTIELFEANYTHNCNTMAAEAGIYKHVWRPDELGITTAGELIEPLRDGIAAMEADPQRFIALNPDNGWGSYDTFLPWLREYLAACVAHPKAKVNTCR